ncbi:MAG: 6,7-dimethyl-8-ribityllumazine synthase [Candidatus Thermoplasmatota archaeon]|nr:6,7-dimethyl-8-ribityllumazine synthase [Candidatus Thermoplasmatota archaeon]
MEEKMKMGIVVSEFNYDINQMMLERAEEHADFLGAEVTEVKHVPGVFDMPLAIKKLLKRDDIDGVVTLGTVIKGETEHDKTVMAQAARKITDLSLDFEKPVSLGITGPGMSRMEAEERIERAKNAVESAVKMYERNK